MKLLKVKIFSLPVILCIAFMMLSMQESSASGFDAPPQKSYYFIKSVKSGGWNRGYWDQPGHPKRYKQGHNIAVWAKDGGADQQFRFISAGGGWYYIRSANGGYVDIENGRNRDGVNIRIWTRNNSAAQKFRFKHLGNGKWKIYTAWNRAICLDGRRDRNGSNVHIWNDHNGSWMEWSFMDYRTGRKYIPSPAGISKPVEKNPASADIKGKLQGYDFDARGGRQTTVAE